MAFLIEDKHAAPGLIQRYSIFGPPEACQNDNGGESRMEAFTVQQQSGAHVVVSKTSTPRSNGGVEKANGQLKRDFSHGSIDFGLVSRPFSMPRYSRFSIGGSRLFCSKEQSTFIIVLSLLIRSECRTLSCS